MAPYIQTSILFQSYVHIDGSYDDIRDEIETLTNDLDEFVSLRAKHFLYPDVDVDLEFKEGSIKTYATVRGTLNQCLKPNYQDFSKEIDQLWWFAKRLSDAAVMEIAFSTGSLLRSIEHTEARPGIIGQTKRILDGLFSLNYVDTDRAASFLTKRVRSNRIDTEKLLTLVTQPDKTLIKMEFSKILKLAPAKPAKELTLSVRVETDYKEAMQKFWKLLEI